MLIHVVPAGQGENACREVFFERGLAGSHAIAALPERIARAVDVERRAGLGKKQLNALIRVVGVDVRSGAAVGAESIAHAVFDTQGDEIKAFERRLHGSGADANTLADVKPFMPGDVARHPIDVLFLLIRAFGQFDENSGGVARMQVGPIQGGLIRFALNAAAHRNDVS